MFYSKEATYLKRSAFFLKISAGLFLFSISMSAIVGPLVGNYPDFFDFLTGLPIFGLFFTGPIGLLNSLKSYRNKEGSASARFTYLIGNLFICAIILGAIAIFVNDITKVLL